MLDHIHYVGNRARNRIIELDMSTDQPAINNRSRETVHHMSTPSSKHKRLN